MRERFYTLTLLFYLVVNVKKFGLAMILLLIVGSFIFVVMISGGTDHSTIDQISPLHVSGNGKPDVLRDRVVAVALADPQVSYILNSSDTKSEPEYIPPGKTDLYVNNSTRYAGVSFHTTVAAREQISLKVIVDTGTMQEMGVFYSGLPHYMDSWFIIPPDNGFYDVMGSGYNLSWPKKYAVPEIQSAAPSMNVSPAGARLYPIIVDGNDLGKYLNGSPYRTPELIDPDTRETVHIDGSRPLVPGSLKGVYELPPELQSYKMGSDWNTWYYLILLNRDAGTEVRVVVGGNPLPYIGDLPAPAITS